MDQTVLRRPAAPRAESAALPAPLAAYHQRVEALRRSPFMDYPAHVHMETLAVCNAACVMCPYPTMERKGTKMPDELIAKIVDDLRDVPPTLRFQLSPFKVNEPFLDVRIFDVLRLIESKLPNADITLTTNASPLTEKRLRELATFTRIGYLWISVNDHREAKYEATMGLPYARTVERLDLIHRLVVEGTLRTRVVLSRVGDGTPADKAFPVWVAKRYPRFEAAVTTRGSWIGQAGVGAPPQPVGCTRWFDLSITASGRVAHCCMDGKLEYPIGDVTTTHCLEVYNAPEYRRLRESTATRLDATPCNGCGFL